MDTTKAKEQMAEASPRFKAGITGVFYLVTILTGGVALSFRAGWGWSSTSSQPLVISP
jgi:hypothetical protein